ncbi:YggS family pyridoxal phosphate-dependent enzyme [Candidatus Pelagibacter sp.]|nr:YggS family pyridoxal phosphate-dependent enzyme [Candidatus Pelagibacter sp.]
MHLTVKNLLKIKENVKQNFLLKNNLIKTPKIIAVSKTFKLDHIMPLIEYGHIDYGENKVQEALEKWSKIKEQNNNIKLHLIGRLQTNKVKIAIKLFDYIHSLDSKKLADKISNLEIELNLKTKLFIQVNIGDEQQKSGISRDEVKDFYIYCKSLNLNIIGLMCIPPYNEDSSKYFQDMVELNNKLNLEELSMGMSSDYMNALRNNSTFIRIGSSIFGERS